MTPDGPTGKHNYFSKCFSLKNSSTCSMSIFFSLLVGGSFWLSSLAYSICMDNKVVLSYFVVVSIRSGASLRPTWAMVPPGPVKLLQIQSSLYYVFWTFALCCSPSSTTYIYTFLSNFFLMLLCLSKVSAKFLM